MEFDISIVKLSFGAVASAVFFFGFLINVCEKHLPRVVVDAVKYGKLTKREPFFTTVPKSWFKHFYVVGVIWAGTVMMIFLGVYLFGRKPPKVFTYFLDAVASKERPASGTPVGAVLGIFLYFSHCVARLLETWCISVYSPGRINIAHYAAGILHFIGSVVAIAAESPGFSNVGEPGGFSLADLTLVDYCGVLIFCLASYEQWKSAVILANLRKNKNGVVRTLKHLIPRGRLFEVISSPHMAAEIFIYVALTVIFRSNQTWWFVFMWVLVNQSEVAWLNHKWYQENFPNYPKVRKALIPYVL